MSVDKLAQLLGENNPKPERRPVWKILLLDIHWLNLFSPGVWFSSVITGIMGAVALALFGAPESVSTPFGVTLVFVLVFASMFIPRRCQRCRARVRIGATACKQGHSIATTRHPADS